MQRREFVVSALAATTAATLWADLNRLARAQGKAAAASDPLFDAVCDLVIPDSDTPGAKRAGVARFLVLALAHGIAGSATEDRHRLEAVLNGASHGDFVSLSRVKQHDVLEAVDAAAYGTPDSVWPRIKGLILMGYYTSEIGATQELRYQLVPGRFDPDVSQGPSDRAFSNDWTGQRF
jgi:hypothetical protein